MRHSEPRRGSVVIYEKVWGMDVKVVEVDNVGMVYDKDTVALESVSFSVDKGEFVSIIGRSGAGKTSLIKILNGGIRPTEGTVGIMDSVKGEMLKLNELRGRDKRRVQRRIGTIYQDFCLVDNLSCRQNVLNAALPEMNVMQVLMGLFGNDRKVKAEEALDKVGLLNKSDILCSQLSGGQKQRVAIARSIMQESEIILADEPVASLDPYTSEQILELLSELTKSGMTVIMNSHNVELSLKYSDRIIGIKDGKLFLDKEADKVTDDDIRMVYGDVDWKEEEA